MIFLNVTTTPTPCLPSAHPPPTESPTSTLELVFISIAIITAIALPIIQIIYQRAQTFAQANAPALVCSALFFATIAVAISITTLIFAWVQIVPLDTLSTIVFALIPALLAFPFDLIIEFILRLSNPSVATLYIRPEHFQYLLCACQCGHHPSALRWRQNFGGPCEGQHCRASLYLRLTPKHVLSNILEQGHDYFNHYINPEQPLHRDLADDGGELVTRGTNTPGRREGHTRHCVLLRDVGYGGHGWWFCDVASKLALSRNPASVHVASQAQLLRGLALVADIVAVGDLVLEQTRDYFKWTLLNDDVVRNAVHGRAVRLVNSLMDKIGLDEWGHINSTILSSQFQWPCSRPNELGLLLFILTVKSDLFSRASMPGVPEIFHMLLHADQAPWRWLRKQKRNRVWVNSGQDVLSAVQRAEGSVAQFNDLKWRLCSDWLALWGVRPETLANALGNQAGGSRPRRRDTQRT